ncbi:MAG: hypothetical protein ACXWP5_06650 [Bdellovibrionota bacterium]
MATQKKTQAKKPMAKSPAKPVQAPKSAAKNSKLAALKSFVFGGNAKAGAAAGKKTAAPAKPAKAVPAAPKKLAAKAAPAAKTTAKAPVKGATPAKGSLPLLPAAAAAKPLVKPARKGKGTPKAPIYTSGIRNGITVQIDSNGEAVCREVACDGLATSGGYCRLHYVKNWKMIKRKELILKEGKLIRYIEELVAKYPEKYIEAILMDLTSDKEFAQVIHDLDLDESVEDFEADGENVDGLVDNIKRDFEDDTEGF